MAFNKFFSGFVSGGCRFGAPLAGLAGAGQRQAPEQPARSSTSLLHPTATARASLVSHNDSHPVKGNVGSDSVEPISRTRSAGELAGHVDPPTANERSVAPRLEVQEGNSGSTGLVHSSPLLRPCTVRILHMSDTHALHRTVEMKYPLPPADVLVHTGDFTDQGTDAEFADFNSWLGELRSRFRFIVVIGGNHEWKAVEKAKQSSEIPQYIKDETFLSPEYMKCRLSNATHVLEHELADIMGIRFFGSPWCPWHAKGDLDEVPQTKHKPGLALALNKWLNSNKDCQAHRFDEIPNDIDVLLTHGPPRGILDLMEGGRHPYGSSVALRESIETSKPQVHLFGHCHEQRGYWIQQRDGSFQGGVEYQPAPGVPWHHIPGPPVGYPCQLIACTALKNHHGLDGAGKCLVAPARLILAEGVPGAWSFRLGEPGHTGPTLSDSTFQRWLAEDDALF